MAVAAEPPDRDLLQLMVAGDRDAFATLYRRYRDVVFRFALRMSCSDIIARDVTQDVFLAFMRHQIPSEPTDQATVAIAPDLRAPHDETHRRPLRRRLRSVRAPIKGAVE